MGIRTPGQSGPWNGMQLEGWPTLEEEEEEAQARHRAQQVGSTGVQGGEKML